MFHDYGTRIRALLLRHSFFTITPRQCHRRFRLTSQTKTGNTEDTEDTEDKEVTERGGRGLLHTLRSPITSKTNLRPEQFREARGTARGAKPRTQQKKRLRLERGAGGQRDAVAPPSERERGWGLREL